MARLRTRIALIIGGSILALVIALGLFWFLSFSGGTPSKIVDFQPSSFEARADSDFFYSIGDELKNSNQIDPKAQTLLRGHIKNFLVSPDNNKIAVVANGNLIVVSRDGSRPQQIAPADSIYREPKPLGKPFFRDDDFQWSRDSMFLYLIRDEYYESKGSQLFSDKGELWRYEIKTGDLKQVLKPFLAYNYFFGFKSRIYLSVPTEKGGLQLEYYDGIHFINIGEPSAEIIPTAKLASGYLESPFFSYSIIEYMDSVLPAKAVQLVENQRGSTEQLKIGTRAYLTFTQGEGFKGSYYCPELLRSVFLPGDRYFLINTPYCGNYEGQLLIDTLTGKYQRLPKDSVAYLTLNTETYTHYIIAGEGIKAK